MTTTVDLLAAVCAHHSAFGLPAMASVHAVASLSAPQVTVQFACHDPSAIARALLAWADTLNQVTARAWRLPQGDSVHLSVTGLLPGGCSVLVYGGLPATHRALGADLPPNATTTIPLPMLWPAATVEEASA